MITLHNATEGIKNLLKWGGLTLAAITILFFAIRGAINIKEMFSPTPKPPPNALFGKLPAVSFPKKTTENKLTFTINTLTGTLPHFPDRIDVYKVTTPQPNLLARERIQEKVGRIGFRSQAVPVSETVYQWTENVPPLRRLVFDIFLSTFRLTSSYISDEEILNGNNLPDEESARKTAQSFLQQLDSFPSDIDEAKTKTTLLAIRNLSLDPATSLSSAQIIRVDFFQKELNAIRIVYPNPTESPVYVLVGGGKYNEQVVEANFFHQDISTSSAAVYPILSSSQALDILKNGSAYIASYNGSDTVVTIKDVYLGYYLPDKKQEYVQPVIVFEGNNNFYAYVPAIRPEWTTTNSPNQ